MKALYSIAEIRAIEQASAAKLPAGTLMQRAGLAAARVALAYIPMPLVQAKVLLLAGPGNNGGDGLETAYCLAQRGVQVMVLNYANEAKSSIRHHLLHFIDIKNIHDVISYIASTHWNLIIDGLFGIGLARPITGDFQALTHAINAVPSPILALDVPSGLDADTGNIVGAAVRASSTITFIADKPGLHTLHGRDYAGKVHLASLGIESWHDSLASPHIYLNEVDLFKTCLQKIQQRQHESHKGSYGNVAIIGGAKGMAGAALLSGRAALQCGAGRVFIASLDDDDALSYDDLQPELMCRSAGNLDFSSAVLVVGPGLGKSDQACDLLVRALDANTPLVLDADGLNLIASDGNLQKKVLQRANSTISAITLMTPHPLEAARLLDLDLARVQADRLGAARALQHRYKANIILKGSGTVIALQDGKLIINPTGNPGLATAGTGDVLAGICGALLAQSWPVGDCALAAVWLHGRAADVLVEQGIGPVGLTASELIPVVRTLLNGLTSHKT